MAEESYPARIAAAENERDRLASLRDQSYPGTPQWEDTNRRVVEWDGVIAQLNREAGS